MTWSSPQGVAGAPRVTTTVAADFNGDGLTDFAALEGGKHSSGAKLFAWFESNGDGSFTKHPFNAGHATRPFLGSAEAADLDGDGDLDLVFTEDNHSGNAEAGEVRWAENPGGNATGTWSIRLIRAFSSGFEHANDMAVRDFDGDGKLDVAVRHLGDNGSDHRATRILFQNSLTNWTLKTIPNAPREGLAAGDIDGDGRLDLLLNGFWLRSPSNPRTGTWTRYDIDATFFDQPDSGLNNAAKNALADLDGDGDLDAVIFTAEGAPGKGAIYLNDGSPLNGGWVEQTLEPGITDFHQAEVGDLDGDGDLDIVSGNRFEGGIWAYYLDDGAYVERQTVTSAEGLYFGKLFDPDGDGDLDIVGPTRYTGQQYVYLQSGGPPPNEAPAAGFSVSTSDLTASFTDGSTDSDGSIAARAWAFGDGATSSATNPSHTYAAGGTYTVTLTVTDDDGATNATSQSVTVTAPPPPNVPPVAAFTSSTSDLAASFTDGSSDPDGSVTSWSWNFGDGSNPSTAQNPSHVYAAAGTYTVTLTVTDDDGATNATSQSVTVTAPPPPNVPPVAAFTSSTSDLAASFTDGSSDPDGSVTSWSWNFGDGSNPSTAQNPSHVYAAAGTYTVTLTVTDDDGATNATSQSVTVTAPPPPNVPPVAAFTSSTSDLAASFTDGSSDPDGSVTSWSWNFGDGSNPSTAQNPSHVYAAAGTYTVTLTVTDDDGATNATSQSVTVTAPPPPNVPPVAAFTSSTSDLAASFTDGSSDPDGSVTSWSWNFGDGSNPSTAQNPSHVYAAAGTYTVTLTVTDDDDATNATSQSVTVTEPVAENVPPTASFTASCSDLGCTFTDGSTDSDGSIAARAWAFGDGATSSATNPSHTYAAGGTYTVTLTVTDDDGATATASQSVTVTEPVAENVPPTASFTASCSDLGCTFTDGSTDSDGSIAARAWAFGDGATSAATNPSHTYAAGGTYTVTLTVTDDDGATNATSQSVTVTEPGSGPPYSGTLALRYEADEGVTANDGVVAGWADLSGNGNDLSSRGAPQLVESTPSGQPAISFDGTEDMLERTTGFAGLPDGSADRTMLIVARYESSGWGGIGYGNNSCGETFGLVVDTSGDLAVQRWCGDYQTSEPGVGAGWLLQSVVLNGNELSHYKDGALISTVSGSFDTVVDRVVIGAEIDSSPYVDMDVAAVLLYDRALSNSELAEVEAYLQQKFFAMSTAETSSSPSVPLDVTLSAFPNPTAGPLELHLGIPEAATTHLAVFDMLGREVAVLVDGTKAAGQHHITWDTSSYPTGVYNLVLVTETGRVVKRVTVVK